mmetsp:Transcript_796/g.1349  ORF Transcript_796/g.1349 Transcript_796/m.1349 type:complete len:186 (-) Transcript_796:74-631(-)
MAFQTLSKCCLLELEELERVLFLLTLWREYFLMNMIRPLKTELNIDGEEYKGELFDTAGLDFGAMRTTYFREGHMFFILFDLSSDRLSPFEYPKQVIEQIRNVKDDEDQEYHFMLVGNKTDLQRKVSAAEAEEFALSEGIPYRETSAKTGEGVDDIIHEMARFMINHEYPQLRRINPVVNVKRAQ